MSVILHIHPAQCEEMIQARNPNVTATLVNELEGFPLTPVLGGRINCQGVGGSSRVRTAFVESLGSRGKTT